MKLGGPSRSYATGLFAKASTANVQLELELLKLRPLLREQQLTRI